MNNFTDVKKRKKVSRIGKKMREKWFQHFDFDLCEEGSIESKAIEILPFASSLRACVE